MLNQFRRKLGIMEQQKPQEVEAKDKQQQKQLMLPPSRTAEQINIVFEEKIPLLSFGLGDPARFINEAHSLGIQVMAMITTVNEAQKVAEGGADIVVAQGSEAGGHRSTFKLDGENQGAQLIGTLALVPQVVDSVSLPVVAAGGIMDGRGIVACLALGAQGVMLGTCFLAAEESGIFQGYKSRLLQATETDTVITNAFTGRPARCIKNRFLEEFEKANIKPMAWPIQGIMADDIYKGAWSKNNPDYFPMMAGQGLRLLRKEMKANKIVQDLVNETKWCITQLKQMIE